MNFQVTKKVSSTYSTAEKKFRAHEKPNFFPVTKNENMVFYTSKGNILSFFKLFIFYTFSLYIMKSFFVSAEKINSVIINQNLQRNPILIYAKNKDSNLVYIKTQDEFYSTLKRELPNCGFEEQGVRLFCAYHLKNSFFCHKKEENLTNKIKIQKIDLNIPIEIMNLFPTRYHILKDTYSYNADVREFACIQKIYSEKVVPEYEVFLSSLLKELTKFYKIIAPQLQEGLDSLEIEYILSSTSKKDKAYPDIANQFSYKLLLMFFSFICIFLFENINVFFQRNDTFEEPDINDNNNNFKHAIHLIEELSKVLFHKKTKISKKIKLFIEQIKAKTECPITFETIKNPIIINHSSCIFDIHSIKNHSQILAGRMYIDGKTYIKNPLTNGPIYEIQKNKLNGEFIIKESLHERKNILIELNLIYKKLKNLAQNRMKQISGMNYNSQLEKIKTLLELLEKQEQMTYGI